MAKHTNTYAAMAVMATLLIATCYARPISVSGVDRTRNLIFSDGINGTYSSLFYQKSRKERLDIFDSGLTFQYVEQEDPYLSPNRMYFFVNFSSDVATDDDETAGGGVKEFMCAFVRMSDGCVVRVDTGQICGGKWETTSRWVGLDGSSVGDLGINHVTAGKVYSDYSLHTKNAPVSSLPRILKYLPEGTAFDNLLACDPVSHINRETYEELLKLLRRDGDSTNAKKVIKALKR
jgi:hypothetical protein